MANSDNQSTSSLSTIEERAQWEKQLNDLEEETQAQAKEIAGLKTQLERALHDRAMETARLQEEKERLEEELDAIKAKLADCKEREEKLNARIDLLLSNPPQVRSPMSSCSRPASPIPKQGPLPPGYSPLKNKAWAKPQRPYASLSPSKSVESAIDGVDFRSVPVSACWRARFRCVSRVISVSTTILFLFVCCFLVDEVAVVQQRLFRGAAGVPRGHQRVPIPELAREAAGAAVQGAAVRPAGPETPNGKDTERYSTRSLGKNRRDNTAVSRAEIKYQHQEEIASLELMMKASQETMRQMSLKHQQTVMKLYSLVTSPNEALSNETSSEILAGFTQESLEDGERVFKVPRLFLYQGRTQPFYGNHLKLTRNIKN